MKGNQTDADFQRVSKWLLGNSSLLLNKSKPNAFSPSMNHS